MNLRRLVLPAASAFLVLGAGCRWSLSPNGIDLAPPPLRPAAEPRPAPAEGDLSRERFWGKLDVRTIPGTRDAYFKTTWSDGHCDFRIYIDGVPTCWQKIAQQRAADRSLFQVRLRFQDQSERGFVLPTRGVKVVREEANGETGLSVRGYLDLSRQQYQQLQGWRLYWKKNVF